MINKIDITLKIKRFNKGLVKNIVQIKKENY
jgi:hypothetical protein